VGEGESTDEEGAADRRSPPFNEPVTSAKHKKPRAHVEPGVLFPPCRRSSSDFPRIGNLTPW
jgi:hypothetical protein